MTIKTKYEMAVIDSGKDLHVLLFETRRDDITASQAMQEHLAPGSKIRQVMQDGRDTARARIAEENRKRANYGITPLMEPPPAADFLNMPALELLANLQYDDYPEGFQLFESLTIPVSKVIHV